MMPGGHLATSLALAGVAYGTTGSVETAAGCFVGGFLIDVDHYLDYLVFEKQWRRPSPTNFLQYYFSSSPRRLVLPLHSAEFMTVLFGVILTHPWPLLVGYWVGALMHLTFDVLVNGDVGLKKPVLFYFFAYRAGYRFAAEHLIRADVSLDASRRPIRDFFRWKPAEKGRSEDHASIFRHGHAVIASTPTTLSKQTLREDQSHQRQHEHRDNATYASGSITK